MRFKKLFIAITAVVTLATFIGIFLITWFFGDSYEDFSGFKQEFDIQGLEDGAVPQGLGTYYASYFEGEDEEGNLLLDEQGKILKKTRQYFLQSTYMTDGSPSRIYVTSDDGYVGYVTMLNVDGTPHKGHVGGIATNGARLWVGYGDSVLVAQSDSEYMQQVNDKYKEDYSITNNLLDDNILVEIIDKATKNNDLSDSEKLTIKFDVSFKTNCNAAYLYYFDDPRYSSNYDRLYVGEFYRKGNYETDLKHRLETPTGYKNTAFMYEYNVDSSSSNPYGLTRLVSNIKDDPSMTEENNVPKIQKIFSMPELVQGIAFSGRKYSSSDGGIMVLSQSYGLANSHMLCFDWKKMNESANGVKYSTLFNDSFTYEGVYRNFGDKQQPYSDGSLYVYYVDKGNAEIFVRDYSIPSMSEGMCNVMPSDNKNYKPSDRIYVLFESACTKYNKFTRESITKVHSFIPHY